MVNDLLTTSVLPPDDAVADTPALERDHVHEVERVVHVVVLRAAERDEQAVGNELDVLAHKLGVHPDEANREGV
jgi:hypothetical protein